MGEPVTNESTTRAVAWWRGLLTEPTVPFLLVAFVVLVKRDYLPDILIVGASIVIICVDSLRWGFREAGATPSGRTSVPVWLLVGLLAAALGMSLMPRVSRELDLSFTVIGAIALWLAWLPGASPERERSYSRAAPERWWLWWAPALVFCSVEVASLAFQTAPRVDSPAHPSLSGILEPALSHWPARAIALLVWFAAGWWLLRRIRAWAS